MNEIKYIYIYSTRNNEKNSKNEMIEWRDENDGMKDDRRIVKSRKIG